MARASHKGKRYARKSSVVFGKDLEDVVRVSGRVRSADRSSVGTATPDHRRMEAFSSLDPTTIARRP